MPEKPTFASVTDIPCTCGVLARCAKDPTLPITWDERLNEFHITYRHGEGTCEMMLYHCPFCGGATPPSRRGELFHVVTPAEERRLNDLLSDITTVDDCLRRLGPPDEDRADGMATESRGHRVTFRTLRYRNLSVTVDVNVGVRADGTVWTSLSGKYKDE